MRRCVSLLNRAHAPAFDAARPVQSLSTVYTGNELDFVGQKDGKDLLTISAGKGANAGPMQLLLFGKQRGVARERVFRSF